MQPELLKSKEEIVVLFIDTHVGIISDDNDNVIAVGYWRATLGVIASRVIDLVKHDMCSGSSILTSELRTTVELSF